jgi:hypothetical protein
MYIWEWDPNRIGIVPQARPLNNRRYSPWIGDCNLANYTAIPPSDARLSIAPPSVSAVPKDNPVSVCLCPAPAGVAAPIGPDLADGPSRALSLGSGRGMIVVGAARGGWMDGIKVKGERARSRAEDGAAMPAPEWLLEEGTKLFGSAAERVNIGLTCSGGQAGCNSTL